MNVIVTFKKAILDNWNYIDHK